ncbi:MAG: hypothetical protein KTR15_04230 [Phycisphaeraceae bacterium]|nr:hypothetical protein [Phycisphaeraceae bacterium]
MQPPTDKTNNDQTPGLLDLVRADGDDGLGAAMLRLAYMAAAQHRANARPKRVKAWSDDLQAIELSLVKDTPGHGRPALTRSAQDSEPVTTEGDR